MKKHYSLIFLIKILVIPEIVLSNELPQGTVEIYGDIEMSASFHESQRNGGSTTGNDTQSVSIVTTYYAINNVGIGLSVEYDSSEMTATNNSKSELSSYTIGPSLTYNMSLNEKFSFKITGVIAKVSSEFKGGGSTSKANGMAWLGRADLAYFFIDLVSLNAGVNYINISREYDSEEVEIDTSGFGVDIGISVYIY
ncbi:MAG: outer membrane beta-barrel protein [Bacteroidetes bacterium]|nr:outer membrane beta-barrel protein [Bacteroidota bacterium]